MELMTGSDKEEEDEDPPFQVTIIEYDIANTATFNVSGLASFVESFIYTHWELIVGTTKPPELPPTTADLNPILCKPGHRRLLRCRERSRNEIISLPVEDEQTALEQLIYRCKWQLKASAKNITADTSLYPFDT